MSKQQEPLVKIEAVNDIVRSLVAVRITPRQPCGWRNASSAAREYEQEKEVEGVAISLQYIPDDVMGPIRENASRITTLRDRRTLLWDYGGWHCVTAEGYMPLMDELAPLVEERKRLEHSLFTSKYDEVKAATILLLKKMGHHFHEERFPPKDGLPERFAVVCESRPIHAAEDVRIQGLSEAAQETIRKQYEQQIAGQVGDCVEQILGRLRFMCESMEGRVQDKKQKRKKYASFIQSVGDTCNDLLKLNLIKSDRLEAKIKEVKAALTQFTPEAIREVAWTRKVVEKQARTLLDELNSL